MAVWLYAIAAGLTALSLVADALVLSRGEGGPAAARLVDLVDLDAEANAPAFFSTMLLATAAVLLAIIARHRQVAAEPGFPYWWALALVFAALAFDEAASIHETMIGPGRRLAPGNRFLYFGWVIPGTAFVVVVGAFFARFLWRLDPTTRNRFVVAGAVFVGGALGVELIEGYIASGRGEDNWPYVLALTTQEVLEMVGAILFIAGPARAPPDAGPPAWTSAGPAARP